MPYVNQKLSLMPGEKGQLVFLDGKDVTFDIRTDIVTNSVSIVAKHPLVREEMVARQQQLAAGGGVVMDGRDIGTHVLPNAEVKIFLTSQCRRKSITSS